MRILRRSKDAPDVVSPAATAADGKGTTRPRGRGLRKWELLLQADVSEVGVTLASSVSSSSNAHSSPAMMHALRELDLATPNVRQKRDQAQVHALASLFSPRGVPSRRS
jgi:hypothetical protein